MVVADSLLFFEILVLITPAEVGLPFFWIAQEKKENIVDSPVICNVREHKFNLCNKKNENVHLHE